MADSNAVRMRDNTILFIRALMDFNILPLMSPQHRSGTRRKVVLSCGALRRAAGGRCGRDRPCRLTRARAAPAGAPRRHALPGAASVRPPRLMTRRRARAAGAAARRRRARRAAAARTAPAPTARSARRRASWRTGARVGLLAAARFCFISCFTYGARRSGCRVQAEGQGQRAWAACLRRWPRLSVRQTCTNRPVRCIAVDNGRPLLHHPCQAGYAAQLEPAAILQAASRDFPGHADGVVLHGSFSFGLLVFQLYPIATAYD